MDAIEAMAKTYKTDKTKMYDYIQHGITRFSTISSSNVNNILARCEKTLKSVWEYRQMISAPRLFRIPFFVQDLLEEEEYLPSSKNWIKKQAWFSFKFQIKTLLKMSSLLNKK